LWDPPTLDTITAISHDSVKVSAEFEELINKQKDKPTELSMSIKVPSTFSLTKAKKFATDDFIGIIIPEQQDVEAIL